MIFLLLLLSLSASFPFARELSVTTYNVDNLFDTVHEEGKNDWEFTPLGTPGKEVNCKKQRNAYYRNRCLKTNWTKEALAEKIKALAHSLRQGPYGIPDILVLNEVENGTTFEELNKLLGYKQFFITDSPGPRGIDNVVAFKEGIGLKVISSEDILVQTPRPTRSILKVRLRRDNQDILLYASHWPAQGNPDSYRLKAAHSLAHDVMKETEKNPTVFILALGDFNVVDSDNPHALREVLEKELHLVDLYHPPTEEGAPHGSYFYKRTKSWSLLDRILVSKNFLDKRGIDYVANSYRIGAIEDNSTDYVFKKGKKVFVLQIPERFSFRGKQPSGASDHYPISIKIIIPSPPQRKSK